LRASWGLALKRRFNPRLPGGRRPVRFPSSITPPSFNPRLPGGRRLSHAPLAHEPDRFNPRLPGGRRHGATLTRWSSEGFNPRLPGGRRLYRMYPWLAFDRRFQSTPSGGKATSRRQSGPHCRRSFNPRLPGGRRPIPSPVFRLRTAFQSTPSGGKATCATDG